MLKILTFWIAFTTLFCISWTACQAPTPISKLLTIEKKECFKRNILPENNVAHICDLNIAYPSVLEPYTPLKASVERFVGEFVASNSGLDVACVAPDSALPIFTKVFRNAFHDNPNMSDWSVEIWTEILTNSTKIASIRMDAYTNLGGAHPNKHIQIENFDPATGQKIPINDLISDKNALLTLCEKKYHEVKKAAFDTGFTFTPEMPFKLPNQIGIAKDGVLFYYNPYEVAPYAVGPAEFTIPFLELDKIMNVGKYQ